MAFLNSISTTALVLTATGSLFHKPPGLDTDFQTRERSDSFTLSLVGGDRQKRPYLPGELVAHVLGFIDLLDSSPGASPSSTSTLFSAALVSRTWTPWALERLYYHCKPGANALESLAASWAAQFPCVEGSESQLGSYSRLQHLVRFEGLFPSLPPEGYLPTRHPLRTLDLCLHSGTDAGTVHKICLHSPPVERLLLASEYKYVSGGSLVSLLGRSPGLKHLTLPESYGEDRLQIDDFFLSLLPKFCPLLRSLTILTNGHITDKGVPWLAALTLEVLRMDVVPWRINVPRFLDALPLSLTRLGIGKFKSTHSDNLTWSLRERPIKTLELPRAEAGLYSAEFFERILEAAPGLQKLDLEIEKGTRVPPPAPVPAVQPEPNLEAEPEDPNAPLLPLQPAQPAPDPPFHFLPLLDSRLTHLRLKGHELPSEFVGRLLACGISVVDLRDCGGLVEFFTSAPSDLDFSSVRVLDVRGTGVSPSDILAMCTNLKVLGCDGFEGASGVRVGTRWIDVGDDEGVWEFN